MKTANGKTPKIKISTETPPTDNSVKVVVLISGGGTNLQALIDAHLRGELPVTFAAVISNRPDAYGLQRAQRVGIETRVLDHRGFDSRASFDRALMSIIDSYQPQLVILAGFMRILTPALVTHFKGRMLNIHPSLLPKYQGLHTHQRALDAGDNEHGTTVHFVTEELDGGPSVIQARVPILPNDDAETLAQRVLRQEHRIYPMAVKWFTEARLKMENGKTWLDGEPLPKTGYLIEERR